MWFIVILSHLTEDGTAFTYESNHSLPHRSGDSCDLKSRKGQTRQTVSNPSNQNHRDVKVCNDRCSLVDYCWRGANGKGITWFAVKHWKFPNCSLMFLSALGKKWKLKRSKQYRKSEVSWQYACRVLFYPCKPTISTRLSSLGHGITTTKTKEDHQGWHQGNDPPTSRIL